MFVPMESASLKVLSTPAPLTPLLKTPSQSNTRPRTDFRRAASTVGSVRKTPPSVEKRAAISVRRLARISHQTAAALITTEQRYLSLKLYVDIGIDHDLHPTNDLLRRRLAQPRPGWAFTRAGAITTTLAADRHSNEPCPAPSPGILTKDAG